MMIAITGAGIISAIGNDKKSVLRALQNGETGVGGMQHLHSTHDELPVGEVKLTNCELKRKTGLPDDALISRTALLGIDATKQALEEAGLTAEKVAAHKLKVVFISGTTVAGMDITEEHFDDAAKSDGCDCAFISQHECGRCTETIAGYFDGIFCDCTTISTACSSAANAIMLGARLLAEGDADIVVAGGAEALSRFHLNGFNALMILDHERCRPFDSSRAGLNLGEGAAYIVMAREDTAVRLGNKPSAYLTGYGNACDAFHQTASSANGEGAYRAMSEALNVAGLLPKDIQYVNAHGTGTPSNDKSESAALRRVFGEAMPAVSSTKSYTGHTTSASGSIEAVICILALRYGLIPGNGGWSSSDEECINPTSTVNKAELRHVMCNSFGFGGNDTSLIISSEATGQATTAQKVERHRVKVAAIVEITDESELSEVREFVTPMEARRMGKLAKGATLSSLKALRKAGLDAPDAIVSGTRFGCLVNTERILTQMEGGREESISPTDFMQSTHNTIGGGIAIKLKCHGYNVTYSHCKDSLRWAINDAEMLIESGKCKSVLVGCHDEMSPIFGKLLERNGEKPQLPIHSTAIVLVRND